MFSLERIPVIASLYGVSWTSKLVGLAIAVVFGSVFFGAAKILGAPGLAAAAILFCAGTASGYLLWMLSCRTPRNKPGMIGIALAIKAETEEEHRRIRTDFIQEISRCLSRNETVHPFYVYEIPGHLAPEVNDFEGAAPFLKKSRGHLLIWGSIRTRTKSKVETYCLTLEGVVTHSIIEHERSQAFSKEMRHAIPAKTEISLANELRGFESTSKSISIGVQYIVAIAAALSGDWVFSQTLLLELQGRIGRPPSVKNRKTKGKRKKPEASIALQELVPLRLADVCLGHCHAAIKQWQNNKEDETLLARAEVSLEHYRNAKDKVEGYGYWIPKALLEVTLRRDLAAAERMLLKCRTAAIDDPAWRLSLAFVKVINGNVMEALNLYDAALERHVHPGMLLDIEDYVQWWLSKHNGPPALYLLSAMLNAHGKCDKQLALSDLDTFETLAIPLDAPLKLRASTLRVELELPDSSGNFIKSAMNPSPSKPLGAWATA